MGPRSTMSVCVFDCIFDGVLVCAPQGDNELSGRGTEPKWDLHRLPLDTTGTAAEFPLPHLYFSLPSFCLFCFPSPLCYFPSSHRSSTVGQSHMAAMGRFRKAADLFCMCVCVCVCVCLCVCMAGLIFMMCTVLLWKPSMRSQISEQASTLIT